MARQTHNHKFGAFSHKKEGSGYDLAIALGVLAASGQCNTEGLGDYYFLGELSLDGSVRPTRGILPISMAISASAVTNIVLPRHNAKEAALVSEINAWPIETLRDAVDFLNNPAGRKPFALDRTQLFAEHARYPVDFCDVNGQTAAKRSLEVAVAGGHNILSMGTQYDRRAGKRTDYVPNVIGHWTQTAFTPF